MKLFPPPNHKLSLLGAYVAYPIGKLALRLVTLGRYPPEDKPHNTMMVGLTPWFLLCIVVAFAFS